MMPTMPISLKLNSTITIIKISNNKSRANLSTFKISSYQMIRVNKIIREKGYK